jgi:hypothetical protein
MPDATTTKIAALNDQARQGKDHCRIMLTRGVLACDPITVAELMIAVEDFDEFTPNNDPYGEHDFGAITLEGITFFWKIDHWDCDLQMQSPDPSDPAVTARVLTIMLAEEY